MTVYKQLRIVRTHCIGEINAGNNILPFIPQRQPLKIILPKNLACKDSEIIVLKIVGDSLNEARLTNGDYLICRTRFELSEIRQDTICAVHILTRNEIVAKRIRIGNGTVTLLAANREYEPQTFAETDIEILGIAVGGAFYF